MDFGFDERDGQVALPSPARPERREEIGDAGGRVRDELGLRRGSEFWRGASIDFEFAKKHLLLADLRKGEQRRGLLQDDRPEDMDGEGRRDGENGAAHGGAG